jgi:hypothetical protein
MAIPGLGIAGLGYLFKQKIPEEKRSSLLAKFHVRVIRPKGAAPTDAVALAPIPLEAEIDDESAIAFDDEESEAGIDFDVAPATTAVQKPPVRQPPPVPAATITVACTCGKKSTVDRKFAGKRAKCKVCGNIIKIPAA